MQFTPININTWPRNQIFYYFTEMAPTGYSVTINIDVTEIKEITKANGIKFFPAYLWLITRNLNRQIEFKVAIKDDILGYYDTLTPLYASFHEDDKTFSLMWTEYNDNFLIFYKSYLDNQKRYGNVHGILSQPETPPPNSFTVSCIPWVSFSNFCVHSYENKPYYFPSVESGKFFKQSGHTYMPLSLTCHHATTDGYHINLFIQDLLKDIKRFETFI